MIERDLKLLLEEDAVRSVCVVLMSEVGATTYSEHSYQVLINGKPLRTARCEVRRFAKLDTVASFMLKLGITDFSVSLKSSTGANGEV